VIGVAEADTPYTIPAADTVATDVLELLHEPPEPPSASTIVPGKQSIDDGPEIAVVAILVVIVAVPVPTQPAALVPVTV